MKLDSFLIGFVIFSLIVVTGVLMVQDVNTTYGVDVDTGAFNETYDTIDEMYEISTGMQGHVLDTELSDTEAWESSVKGSYSAVRLIKNTFSLFSGIITSISETLGVPGYFIKFALTAMTISILFGIIYLFMRAV